MAFLRIAPGILLMLVVTACQFWPFGASAEALGKRLYGQNCVSCHGEDGERLPVAPLSSKEFLDSRGDVNLLVVVREGRGTMPGWSQARGGPLDDDQVLAVLAYINSLAERSSAASQAILGKGIFLKACGECHGRDGRRIPVAPLDSSAFLSTRSESALFAALEGGKGTMPPQGKAQGGTLTSEDVGAVVAYLRYLGDQRVATLAAEGQRIYSQRCVQCHGEKGDIFPNARLNNAAFLKSRGDGPVALAIANGKVAMPAFGAMGGGPLSAGDIEAVVAYLKVLAGMQVTLLTGGAGAATDSKALFTTFCTPCHSGSSDRLTSKAFLESKGDALLVQAVSEGTSQGMPAWSKEHGGSLSQEQIKAIVQYLVASAGAVGSGDKGGPVVGSGTPASSSGATASADGAVIEAGKRIFTQSCVACHGQRGDVLPGANLSNLSWLQQKGNATLVSSISTGKGGMPAFGKATGGTLSDEDVQSVVQYLVSAATGSASGGAATSTQPKPTPAPTPGPSPTPIPRTPVAITSETGRELFTKYCSACHGGDGLQVSVAPIGSRKYVSSRKLEGLMSRISSGAPTSGMPAWALERGGPLAPEEIRALVDYLMRAAQ